MKKTLVLPEKLVHAGSLVLVNGQYPYHAEISEGVLFPVASGGGEVLLERRAAVLFERLMDAVGGRAKISAVSGWRSSREQREIYDRSVIENGADFTARFVARPDHSEHQTGLAIDLGLRKPDIDFIRPDFPRSGICQRFREKAVSYGFIERYPRGMESVTGIDCEPWHFRYVGAPHAAVMAELSLTLEEYHDFLKQYPYGAARFEYRSAKQLIGISYFPAEAGADACIEIDEDIPYAVSGNNADGFILTEWRNIGAGRSPAAAKAVSAC